MIVVSAPVRDQTDLIKIRGDEGRHHHGMWPRRDATRLESEDRSILEIEKPARGFELLMVVGT